MSPQVPGFSKYWRVISELEYLHKKDIIFKTALGNLCQDQNALIMIDLKTDQKSHDTVPLSSI